MSAPRLATSLAVLLIAGCGATPPQAPPRQAARLDSSLSAISTACGLAYQLSAFGSAPAGQLASLEATASTGANKLASVFHANPGWIYQGETVRKIVRQSVAMLGACRLATAQASLVRETGH